MESLPPETVPALAAAPFLVPCTRKLSAHWLSHHPHTPAYDQDVYHAAGLRFCIGCFTTYPVFVAASIYLALTAPSGAWWVWLTAGLLFASLQAISSAGLAKLRVQKATVKAALGLGLAAAVHGVLLSPLPVSGQQAALGGLLGLALASTLPRRARMRRGPGGKPS